MKTIVKLSMNGCMPCKQYEPTFKKVAKEFPEHCWEELSLENDNARQLASDLKIRSVPATIVYADGDINSARVKMGIMTEQQLKEWINDSV